MRVEEQFVEMPAGRAFVRRWQPEGPEALPPLVLLHDSLGCVDLWRGFPEALARKLGREVIAYDRLGFGRSSARQGLPSLDFIAEEGDLYFPVLRDALGIRRFSVLGHSVGGAMALMIAATHGSDCEMVITEAAQSFVEQRTLDGIVEATRAFEDPAQLAKLVRYHGTKAQWVLDAWNGVWRSPAFVTWKLDPYLGKISCPALVIHGDQDEFSSLAIPRRIVDHAGGPSRLEVMKNCGHVPHREQPDRVLDLISGFAAQGGTKQASIG